MLQCPPLRMLAATPRIVTTQSSCDSGYHQPPTASCRIYSLRLVRAVVLVRCSCAKEYCFWLGIVNEAVI